MAKLNPRNFNRGGFTLIELVVVVLIIGLLAGITVPRLTKAWDDAQASTCQANMKQIEAALELYYFENGNYPPKSTNNSSLSELKLKGVPKCPQKNTEYEYEAEGSTRSDYRLQCPNHGFFITSLEENFSRGQKDGP